MKIVILMSGGKFEEVEGQYPLYMTEIDGQMILQKQINYCQAMNPTQIICCVKSEEIKQFHVDDVIHQCGENMVCVPVNRATAGSVCTALLAAEYIDGDEEVILMAIDDLLEEDGLSILESFRMDGDDAGVVSFRSIHPRYSFAKVDVSGKLSEVAEKQPISKHALASFYYFKKAKDFLEAAKSVIRKDTKINGSFYISQTLNELILGQKSIGLRQISSEKFHPLKSKMQLARYVMEYKENQVGR